RVRWPGWPGWPGKRGIALPVAPWHSLTLDTAPAALTRPGRPAAAGPTTDTVAFSWVYPRAVPWTMSSGLAQRIVWSALVMVSAPAAQAAHPSGPGPGATVGRWGLTRR